MKKSFTLICLILATIIGAGFASGKEIQIFFSEYGFSSIIAIILVCLLFYFVIKIYLSFGKKFCVVNYFDANKILFGRLSNYFNLFISVCYLIVLAGMFAGVYEVYLFVTNIVVAKILTLITALLCVLENSGGMKNINFINNLFIPITMILLIVSAFLNFQNIDFNNVEFGNLTLSIWSAIIYVGINILLAGSMLIQEGHKYNKNQIKFASLISSVILTIIIFLFNLILLNFNTNSEMPMLLLSFNLSNVWGYLNLISIWFCIYSAITSVTYVLSVNVKNNSNKFISNLIVVTIAYIISLFGFGKIIEYLYPIIGLIGVVYTVVVLVKYKQKNSIITLLCK